MSFNGVRRIFVPQRNSRAAKVSGDNNIIVGVAKKIDANETNFEPQASRAPSTSEACQDLLRLGSLMTVLIENELSIQRRLQICPPKPMMVSIENRLMKSNIRKKGSSGSPKLGDTVDFKTVGGSAPRARCAPLNHQKWVGWGVFACTACSHHIPAEIWP